MANVLWIEEEAETKFANYAFPAILAGHVLDIVHSATDAAARITTNRYDVIILDILINAGSDPMWQRLDLKRPKGGDDSYLGLQLARALFDPGFAEASVDVPDNWLQPEQVRVFTVVEDEKIMKQLHALGIQNIALKAKSDYTAIKRLIEVGQT